MPVVPVYGAPTVAPANLPDSRQQTPFRLMQQADIGPGNVKSVGSALERAGGELSNLVTMDQIETNETKAKEFDANLMGAHQAIINGSPDDPDSGYLAQKGKAAVDGYAGTVKKLQASAVELSQGLDNPAQQKLVSHTAQIRTQAAIVQATQHYAQQQQVYQESAGKTRIKVAQDGAAQAFNPVIDSPNVVDTTHPDFDHEAPANNTPYQLYLQTVVSEAKDQTVRMGIAGDKELSNTYIQDQLRAAYMGTVVHLLGGGVKGAKQLGPGEIKIAQQFYDKVKGDLTAEQQDRIEPMLEAGANKDKSLDLFFEAQKDNPADYAKQISFLDGQYKDGKVTAEVHDMAVQRATAANSQRRAEQSETDRTVIGQVWDMAHHGGSLATLPPDTLAYIKQRGIGPQVDAIFKRGDGEGTDDAKLYSDLSRMAVEDPSKFVQMDLALFSGQMSKARWNSIMGMQNSINRSDVKAMDRMKVVHSAMQDSMGALKAAGINVNAKPDTGDAKALADFQATLIDAVTAAQIGREKSPLTRAEARDITLGLLKDQTLSGTGYFGSFFATHKPVWQMTPEERAKPWEIPQADRAQITDSLKRRGLPVTDANIQAAYKIHNGVR